MDRGYGYPDHPRSPVRLVQPARGPAGSLGGRDYYDPPPYYGNPRTSGDRLIPHTRPLPGRTADDHDTAGPRRVFLDRSLDPRPRGHSMNPIDRRPLSVLPSGPSDRLRPAVHSATFDRRGSDARDPYYPVSSSVSRPSHVRHSIAEPDDRGRYPHSGRPERAPQYADDRGYYVPESSRRADDRPERRAIEAPPSHGRHLLADHALRPRAGSDVGARPMRPDFGGEYTRSRPRDGPPPSSRGFDKVDRADRGGAVRHHEYRVPRNDSSSIHTGTTTYRDDRDRDRRRLSQQPIMLHQDYDYGYSSTDENRRDRHRQQPYHDDANGRRYEQRHDSDSDNRRNKAAARREPSSVRERPQHGSDLDEKHVSSRNHQRHGSEDRRYRREEDDKRSHHKSHRDDDRDRDRDKERDRDRDHDKDRDRDRDREEERRRKHRDRDDDRSKRGSDDDSSTRHIAEALGLGGAGTALVGLARNAIKKRAGQYGLGGGSDDEREKDRDRGDRRRRRDETEDERRDRHRRRREQETEEETQERRRRRRERRDRHEGEGAEGNEEQAQDKADGRDKSRSREKDEDREKRRDRPADGNDKEKSRDLLVPGMAGAAAGALVERREKSRSRDGDDKDDKEHNRSKDSHGRDNSRHRRRNKHRGSESDTTESSSSESEVGDFVPPPMRSRANSAARPAPTKGILKTPTTRFPDREDNVREGVAPLKDAKGHRDIPEGARWTRISRKLVNPDALREAQERFEERVDHVIVLRVLTHDEIQKLTRRTQELREKRQKDHRHEMEVEERERREQEELDRPQLAIADHAHSAEEEAENAVRFAVDHRNERAAASPTPAHPAYGSPQPEQQRQMRSPNESPRGGVSPRESPRGSPRGSPQQSPPHDTGKSSNVMSGALSPQPAAGSQD